MGIFFLRHMKTLYNQNGIISGSSNCDVLPNQSVSNLQSNKTNFDIALCSPLIRCRSTIKLIPKEKISSIIFTEDLLERNMGILEGLKKETAKEKYPNLFCNRKIDVSAIIPHGETINDVKERLANIVEFIENNHQKNILICSHNQTLKILYFILNNIEINNYNWEHLDFLNGNLINIDYVSIS